MFFWRKKEKEGIGLFIFGDKFCDSQICIRRSGWKEICGLGRKKRVNRKEKRDPKKKEEMRKKAKHTKTWKKMWGGLWTNESWRG